MFAQNPSDPQVAARIASGLMSEASESAKLVGRYRSEPRAEARKVEMGGALLEVEVCAISRDGSRLLGAPASKMDSGSSPTDVCFVLARSGEPRNPDVARRLGLPR